MGRAERIIRSDETLLTAYMLRVAARPGWGGWSEESAALFLLWFALEGRNEHQQVRIGPDYLAFLADPAPPCVTRLCAYLLLRDAEARERHRQGAASLHAWYYCEGVDRHRLGPFISARERRALHEPLRGHHGLTRLQLMHWRHDPSLQARFATTDAQGAAQFAEWFAQEAQPQLPPWARIPPLPAAATPGLGARGEAMAVNLFGFADGVLGLGEDVRLMAETLLRAGCHVAIHNLSLAGRVASSAPQGFGALFSDRPIFETSIFCLPPFEMMRLRVEQGVQHFAGRRNIGLWPWELTSLPAEWGGAFQAVDAIWAISPWLAHVFAGLTDKPVHLARPPVALPPALPARRDMRAGLGLDEHHFMVLAMFDFNSFPARKNPDGAITAFLQAFPEPGGPERLIIKSINGHAHDAALEALRARASSDPRIIILDGAMHRARSLGLIGAADCLISLHRAEGFGRVLAEALLLEVPVVATAWSGNADFLDRGTGYPVGFALRDVGRADYVYVEGSQWAEPDLAEAAEALRAIRAEPGEARARSAAGKRLIERRHGRDAVARSVALLLDAEIIGHRRQPAA
jgi:glycosyltransferase involved in cell wall biosynthesis